MHFDKDLADNKSVISTKSMVYPEGMSKSKIFFSK